MTAEDRKDLLQGYPAIAGHLGLTTRQAKHRAKEGQIPTFKMGRTVCALRSKLDAALELAASSKPRGVDHAAE